MPAQVLPGAAFRPPPPSAATKGAAAAETSRLLSSGTPALRPSRACVSEALFLWKSGDAHTNAMTWLEGLARAQGDVVKCFAYACRE